jgi:hypothetical protein
LAALKGDHADDLEYVVFRMEPVRLTVVSLIFLTLNLKAAVLDAASFLVAVICAACQRGWVG